MSAEPREATGVSRQAVADLEALYRRVDEETRRLGLACEGCGRCCDFAANDYRLYACRLERALVVSSRGLPRLGPDGRCSFQKERVCSIHQRRPLGCRLFFCEAAARRMGEELHERFIGELRALSRRHGIAWDYSPFFSNAPASFCHWRSCSSRALRVSAWAGSSARLSSSQGSLRRSKSCVMPALG